MGGEGADNFIIYSGKNNSIDGYDSTKVSRNTMVNYGEDTVYKNARYDSCSIRSKILLGANSGKAGSIDATIEFALASFDVNLTDPEKALETVQACDKMIDYINKQLSCIGATMNRLESALDTNSIPKINVLQTKSLITDADIAQESISYVKNSICKDVATALFTQSNQIKRNYYSSLIA